MGLCCSGPINKELQCINPIFFIMLTRLFHIVYAYVIHLRRSHVQ